MLCEYGEETHIAWAKDNLKYTKMMRIVDDWLRSSEGAPEYSGGLESVDIFMYFDHGAINSVIKVSCRDVTT